MGVQNAGEMDKNCVFDRLRIVHVRQCSMLMTLAEQY